MNLIFFKKAAPLGTNSECFEIENIWTAVDPIRDNKRASLHVKRQNKAFPPSFIYRILYICIEKGIFVHIIYVSTILIDLCFKAVAPTYYVILQYTCFNIPSLSRTIINVPIIIVLMAYIGNLASGHRSQRPKIMATDAQLTQTSPITFHTTQGPISYCVI